MNNVWSPRWKRLIATLLLGASGGCSGGAQLSVDTSNQKVSHEIRGSSDSGDDVNRLSRLRIKDGACAGYDLAPEQETLTIQSLKSHLNEMGIDYSVQIERDDLHLFDISTGPTKARLRVATLPDPRKAGRHLHQALLEHGSGYWGVHRSNLAVLGPQTSTKDAVQFAASTGLACWGVLTMAGRDDSFAIPGGYFEL